jgi:hypothetical protein
MEKSMRSSRGMGCIAPTKMPKAKIKARRDDTGFSEFSKGGEVWNKPRPKGLGKSKKLTASQKSRAKAAAKAGGRPYPNMVDNIRAARSK